MTQTMPEPKTVQLALRAIAEARDQLGPTIGMSD